MTSYGFVSPWQLSMAGKRRSHQSSTRTLNQHLLHLLVTVWNITDSPSIWVLLPFFTIFYHLLPSFSILCLIKDCPSRRSPSLNLPRRNVAGGSMRCSWFYLSLYYIVLSLSLYMYIHVSYMLFCIYMLPY